MKEIVDEIQKQNNEIKILFEEIETVNTTEKTLYNTLLIAVKIAAAIFLIGLVNNETRQMIDCLIPESLKRKPTKLLPLGRG
jgi:putative exporter of polyketide antibiotics